MAVVNVFTGWTGAAFAILIWLLASVVLAAAWHLTRRAWQRKVRAGIRLADQYPVRDRFDAINERIHGGVSHCPRCLIGRDHRYLPVVIPCADHKPAGKHHATAPVYGPEPVVAEPDYDEWVDEWNRRYAE